MIKCVKLAYFGFGHVTYDFILLEHANVEIFRPNDQFIETVAVKIA